MLTNIFKQLASEALKVSRNQTVSYIVQNLVKEATAGQLIVVMMLLRGTGKRHALTGMSH